MMSSSCMSPSSEAFRARVQRHAFFQSIDKKEVSMLVNKTAERKWSATDYPGIERSLFRNDETGGRASIVRLAQGSRFPRHGHQGVRQLRVTEKTQVSPRPGSERREY